MSIEDLRAKALAYNASLRFRYPVSLNGETRQQLDTALKHLAKLREERAKLSPQLDENTPTRRTMGQKDVPVWQIDKDIEAAEQKVDALEAGIPADELIVVTFGRHSDGDLADSDFYTQLQDAHTVDGKIQWGTFWDELQALDYRGCEDAEGNPVTMDWSECKAGFLNNGDLELINEGLGRLHRGASFIPFKQRTSGRHDTT